jgi:hypothetical protein
LTIRALPKSGTACYAPDWSRIECWRRSAFLTAFVVQFGEAPSELQAVLTDEPPMQQGIAAAKNLSRRLFLGHQRYIDA